MGIDGHGPSCAVGVAELNQEVGKVWDPDTAELNFLELYDGDKNCERPHMQTIEEVRDHLRRNRKDPRYRFVFVEADNSRAPLNCSWDMFNLLATYQQISPTFISNILSFGEQDLPRDFNLMTFQHEDNLHARKSDLVPLPDLGRSGREIRHCFNIRTVEPSKAEPGWYWSMRNVAVYHSFDVETGRSFWMNIKANTEIRDRIDKVVEKPLFSAKSQETIQGSFASTLEILWVIVDWSDENWRGYLNNLDDALRKIVIKAKTAQIDRYAKMPEDLVRSLKRRVTAKSTGSPQRASTWVERIHRGVTAVVKVLSKKEAKKTKNTDEDSGPEEEQRVLENLTVLKTFTFEELQRLHLIGERITEALLVIGLTVQVVQWMTTYYTTIFESDILPQGIRDSSKPDMALFQQRMGNIERNLRMREKQLESMTRLAQEAKALFDGILQYRNLQISLLFAQSGYDSSQKMEKIARKTEQETTSMHVITFVTLLFLPGTFLASFFQSGVIQLNVPDIIEGDWVLLPEAWDLFAKISFLLMLVVFVVWGITIGCLTHRAKRQKVLDDLDMV